MTTFVVAWLLAACCGCGSEPRTGVVWTPMDFSFEAEDEHSWRAFPAKAVFAHVGAGDRIELNAFWLREKTWTFRFAPTRAGLWTYATTSEDPGLDGQTGAVQIIEALASDVDARPSLRGRVRASANGRFFVQEDGRPFLLWADTFWAGNTARVGLGDHEDGPFFEYLDDRREKGFTAVLMQTVHGFGDYPDDPEGHANEGGHLLLERDFERLNPEYLRYTDLRWQAVFERGFVTASPLMWWGKTRNCVFDPQQAQALASYLVTRYGAFNVVWALSGEYQYVFRDCGWTEQDINALGEAVQAHNSYRRPVSIHPSGQTRWGGPHGVQSSRAFQASSWLDHHWLQTGQSVDRMFWIVERAEENRALEPARPVFCSEAYYDRVNDSESAYHSRWEAWTALLSGCAGYGYGAQGLWQFRDSSYEEPGKPVEPITEWREAIQFEGSRQAGLVAKIAQGIPWHRLEPVREALLVDGAPVGKPTADDLTPPAHAAIPGELHIAYVPRGNAGRRLSIAADGPFELRWIDPRSGETSEPATLEASSGAVALPERPSPHEDWVAVLRNR